MMPRLVLIPVLLLMFPSASSYELLGYWQGENLGDQFGSAFCTVDFNNDSFDDLVISAPANDEAGLSSGKVYIYYGGPSADTIADLEIVGPPSSFFGQALSPAGDFNNDGYEDLLVGAPFYDVPSTSAGAVLLYYGGLAPDTTPDHLFSGEAAGDYFGIAAAGIGDFNNDTYGDIAIGAYRADWGAYSNSGKVYVYYGGPSLDFVPDKTLVGSADGERFGYSVTSGDFNGNGIVDIAVGAYSYDDAELNMGAIYIFNGGTSPDSVYDMIIVGDSGGYKFGWSLDKGNVNADQYDDLIMGTDGFTIETFAAGKIFIFHGGVGFDDVYDDAYTIGRNADDYLGFSVGSGVDVNNDSSDEVIAGMPGNDDGNVDAGGAILFDGSGSIAPDTTLLGAVSGEEMGSSVSLWQGYGGQEIFVIAAGAPGYDAYRGRVLLLKHQTTSPNQPPVLDLIGNLDGVVGQPIIIIVTAEDPDGDSVTITAENLPYGAEFTYEGWDEVLMKYKGTFSWTPGATQIGVYSNIRFIASDGIFIDDEYISIAVSPVDYICGDVNATDSVNILDITYIILYLYKAGPPPLPLESADVNSSGNINLLDITYLIAYLYKGGPDLNCPE